MRVIYLVKGCKNLKNQVFYLYLWSVIKNYDNMNKWDFSFKCLVQLVVMVCIVGCSTGIDSDLEYDTSPKSISKHAYCREKAIEIANLFRAGTRATQSMPHVMYVLKKGLSTRSVVENEISDTVAFILNYPNNAGFVIVANDKRVDPILAFSDKGVYSLSNEIAHEVFLDNVEYYIHSKISQSRIRSSEDVDTIVYQVGPYVTTNLGQYEPYNRVVDKYHPGCPVGCAPLSCVMAVSHCVDKLIYKGYEYNFKSINKNLNKGIGDGDIMKPNVFGGDLNPYLTWLDTYEGAINAIS